MYENFRISKQNIQMKYDKNLGCYNEGFPLKWDFAKCKFLMISLQMGKF